MFMITRDNCNSWDSCIGTSRYGNVTSCCKNASGCVSVDSSHGKLHSECVAQPDMNYAWKHYERNILYANKLRWITKTVLLPEGATSASYAFLSKHPSYSTKLLTTEFIDVLFQFSNEYRPIVCAIFIPNYDVLIEISHKRVATDKGASYGVQSVSCRSVTWGIIAGKRIALPHCLRIFCLWHFSCFSYRICILPINRNVIVSVQK